MMTTDKYNAIRNYLRERMPEHEINDRQTTSVRPFGFLLRKDEMSHILEFEADFRLRLGSSN